GAQSLHDTAEPSEQPDYGTSPMRRRGPRARREARDHRPPEAGLSVSSPRPAAAPVHLTKGFPRPAPTAHRSGMVAAEGAMAASWCGLAGRERDRALVAVAVDGAHPDHGVVP